MNADSELHARGQLLCSRSFNRRGMLCGQSGMPNPSPGDGDKTGCMPARLKRRRFTLVELLVVIAIIGMLASLLLPALSQARRRGQVVLCVNNLKSLGIGVTLYAGDCDNWLPYGEPSSEFNSLGFKGVWDRRPALKSAVGDNLSLLMCPLAVLRYRPGGKYYDISDGWFSGSDVAGRLRCSYNLFFGSDFDSTYYIAMLTQPMYKIGQSFIPAQGTAAGMKFRILAGDDMFHKNRNVDQYTHQPAGGVYGEDTNYINFGASYWYPPFTNTNDNSFLSDDGSVEVFSDLKFQDDRLVRIRRPGAHGNQPRWYVPNP